MVGGVISPTRRLPDPESAVTAQSAGKVGAHSNGDGGVNARVHAVSGALDPIYNHRRTLVVSDWEGPWVTSDYAYDLTAAAVPRGGELFSRISEYVIYLAYVKKVDGYQPGDTLALIPSFLIAHDLSTETVERTAQQGARFIKGAGEAIGMLQNGQTSLRIVSTSYSQYMSHTAQLVGIPEEHTKSTDFPVEHLKSIVREEDKELVRAMVPIILKLKPLGITFSSTNADISARAQRSIAMLDEFFFDVLPCTSFGPVMNRVTPVGGQRKLDILIAMAKEGNFSLSETVVIGDSIGDAAMLGEVRKANGLAVSFNGNSYAIRNANVAVVSSDCTVTPVLVQIFNRAGIREVEEVASNWSIDALIRQVAKGVLASAMLDKMFELYDRGEFPRVAWINSNNIGIVEEMSEAFRSSVRGEKIGSLG